MSQTTVCPKQGDPVKFRVLHLSDLHLEGGIDQHYILEKFLESLSRLDTYPDLTIFTGDIGSKGQLTEAVRSKFGELVTNIRKVFDDVDHPVIVVPGNHDVNLKARKSYISDAFEKVNSPSSANIKMEDLNDEILWAHLEDFNSLAHSICPKPETSNKVFSVYRLSTKFGSVGVAALNSTWRTCGGGKKDYGNLYFAEHQIRLALEKIKDCRIKIAAFHHPLEWISVDEQPIIRRSLMQDFDVALFGHNHDSSTIGLTGPMNSIISSQSGCLYQSRDYFNGYLVMDYAASTNEWCISAWEHRQETGFVPNLGFSRSASVNLGGERGQIRVPIELTKSLQRTFDSHLLSYSASDLAPKSLATMFVEPPLAIKSERDFAENVRSHLKEVENKSKKNELLSISEVAKIEGDLVFVGRSEAGKSTLLQYISTYKWHEFSGSAEVGIVISAKRLREGRGTVAQLIELCIAACDGSLNRNDLVKILNAGKLLICLDDVDLNHEKSMRSILEFRQEYRNCRVLYSLTEDPGVAIDPVGVARKLNSKLVYIHSFKRRHTKSLVQRWFGTDEAAEVARLTNTTEQLLRSLNIPRTPFLISILLWIAENHPDSQLVNQAATIDTLLDGLLNKLQESKSRTRMDATFKRHFLMEFAALLDDEHVTAIPAIQFEKFAISYFETRGLKQTTTDLSKELLEKGIIYEGNSEVGFKFDCFRAFFLAEKINASKVMLNKVLSETNVSAYAAELDLFSGLYRDRSEVLERLIGLLDDAYSELGLSVDLKSFDLLNKGVSLLDTDSLQKLDRKFLNNPHLESEVDSALDEMSDAPDRASYDPETTRKKSSIAPSNGLNRLISILRVVSVFLRNSELIADVALKSRTYERCINIWAFSCVATMQSVSTKSFIEASEEVTEGLKRIDKEKLDQLVLMLIPTLLSAIMSECISTPKLDIFIVESAGRSDLSGVEKLFSSIIAMDAGIDAAEEVIEKFFAAVAKDSLSAQILLLKMLYAYTMPGSRKMTDNKRTSLRRQISRRIARISSKSSFQENAAAEHYSTILEKKIKLRGHEDEE